MNTIIQYIENNPVVCLWALAAVAVVFACLAFPGLIRNFINHDKTPQQ